MIEKYNFAARFEIANVFVTLGAKNWFKIEYSERIEPNCGEESIN